MFVFDHEPMILCCNATSTYARVDPRWFLVAGLHEIWIFRSARSHGFMDGDGAWSSIRPCIVYIEDKQHGQARSVL